MKILCVFGEHNYGDPQRDLGYEYTNFIPALRRLGHEVFFFESLNKSQYADFVDLNRSFLKTVERLQPDIILCVLMTYEIWTETFRSIKDSSDIIIINWSTDDSWKYEQFSRFIAPSFHLYATTYSSAAGKSLKDNLQPFFLTQWAASAENIVPPLRAEECRYQVTFIGSAYGSRARWIKSLKKRGINVECFGYGWENGPVAADQIPKIIRESVISLNFSDSRILMEGLLPKRSRQIKARIFEVTGAGGFLLTQSADEIEKFFVPEKEIVLFDNSDELASKIKFFLAHPQKRDEIAVAGNLKTRREHTYDIRFREIITAAISKFDTSLKKREFIFPEDKFARLEKDHRQNSIMRFTRFILVSFCTLVWGRKRGPRAARRLVFEVSWRFAGEKTYSARGWPGRMFYLES